jgi:hypothetical protein
MKTKIAGLILCVLAVMIVPVALPQMEKAQEPVYTFVSEFAVPRASWAQYAEDTDKLFVPIAEKLMADGTLVGWATFEHVVHTPDGYTNGTSWESHSISGLMKVLDEVRKAGPRPGQIAATKHQDLLMVSTTYKASSFGNASGYLRVVCSSAKPDKPEGYTKMLKKLLVPTFDEQFKSGVATTYSVDEQYVNTGAPSTRCLAITYPNAESMDKWAAAINSTLGKMGPAERAEYAGATVPDSRRDIMAHLTHYAHK